MIATSEADVQIEEQSDAYVRYQRVSTGERWEVYGTCDHRGDCLVGAVIDGEVVETIERARELAHAYSGADVPVTDGFSGCCPLRIVVLRGERD